MIHDKRRATVLVFLLLAALGSVSAGDVARFVNLGFSPDSRVFMFAQHGIDQSTSQPYAEIYTVDVPANDFVSRGVQRQQYPVTISPGQDGSGALYSLLPTMRPVVEQYRVSHLRQGRLVYLLVNGEEPRSNLEFRDFESGDRYQIALTQQARGSGESGSAAFYLDITVSFANGTRAEHRVGRPGFFRSGVNEYRINRVLVAPDQNSLVVVIERMADTASGTRIRYMVETVTLR
jgi:predicted secreted protein